MSIRTSKGIARGYQFAIPEYLTLIKAAQSNKLPCICHHELIMDRRVVPQGRTTVQSSVFTNSGNLPALFNKLPNEFYKRPVVYLTNHSLAALCLVSRAMQKLFSTLNVLQGTESCQNSPIPAHSP